ncbi:MAG: nucleotidyltransferase domain-containing protein [Candidatus Hodarchaeales archaeon]|jgi:predicted nucleotidyltransferase
MREKVEKRPLKEFVHLTDDDLACLDYKRKIAIDCLEVLQHQGLPAFTYGSICRGDITKRSDIDVFISMIVPSFRIELALENYAWEEKIITQATPNHAIKGIIIVNSSLSIGFPLTPLKSREEEFYSFAGKLDLNDLKNNHYVPGVNKRLEFISMVPEKKGFWKESIIGMKNLDVAKKLGVSLAIVEERVRVLNIRDKKGRTGVFLKKGVSEESTFEQELKFLADRNPAIRRYLARF